MQCLADGLPPHTILVDLSVTDPIGDDTDVITASAFCKHGLNVRWLTSGHQGLARSSLVFLVV